MATSVSSERAFSQGGITISKRRNCLKGDIVEALQVLKCSIRSDLLSKEAGPSLVSEDDAHSDDVDDRDMPWDLILEDDIDDDNDNI